MSRMTRPSLASGGLDRLHAELARCRACPRLVAWREEVGRAKKRAHRADDYWARPVPGFGDPAGRAGDLRPGARRARLQPHRPPVHRRRFGDLPLRRALPGRALVGAGIGAPRGRPCAAAGSTSRLPCAARRPRTGRRAKRSPPAPRGRPASWLLPEARALPGARPDRSRRAAAHHGVRPSAHPFAHGRNTSCPAGARWSTRTTWSRQNTNTGRLTRAGCSIGRCGGRCASPTLIGTRKRRAPTSPGPREGGGGQVG